MLWEGVKCKFGRVEERERFDSVGEMLNSGMAS